MTWKTLIFPLMMSVSLIVSSNFRECLLLRLRLKYEIEAVVGFSENFTPIFAMSLSRNIGVTVQRSVYSSDLLLFLREN